MDTPSLHPTASQATTSQLSLSESLDSSAPEWLIALRAALHDELSEVARLSPGVAQEVSRLLRDHTRHELRAEARSTASLVRDQEQLKRSKELLRSSPQGYAQLIVDSRYPLKTYAKLIHDATLKQLKGDEGGAARKAILKRVQEDTLTHAPTLQAHLSAVERGVQEVLREKIHRARSEAREETLKALLELLRQWRAARELLAVLAGGSTARALGRGRDLSEGLLRELDINLLQELAVLANSEGVQALLSELGRMRAAQAERERERVKEVVFRRTRRPSAYVREELVGVTRGADLARLLPSEYALMRPLAQGGGAQGEEDELLELLFCQRLTERSLNIYALEGHERLDVSERRLRERLRPSDRGKGPFILCVDTSGSMHGEPERVAKTLALAILRQALMERRRCYLINFSTRIETLELTDLYTSLPILMRFLRFSFQGGTDVEPALTHALDLLERDEYRRADVVVVSDFVMPSLSAPLVSRVQSQRALRTQLHSVVVGEHAEGSPLAIFDSEWRFRRGGWGELLRVASR